MNNRHRVPTSTHSDKPTGTATRSASHPQLISDDITITTGLFFSIKKKDGAGGPSILFGLVEGTSCYEDTEITTEQEENDFLCTLVQEHQAWKSYHEELVIRGTGISFGGYYNNIQKKDFMSASRSLLKFPYHISALRQILFNALSTKSKPEPAFRVGILVPVESMKKEATEGKIKTGKLTSSIQRFRSY